LLTATAGEQAEVAARLDDAVLSYRHGRQRRHGRLAGVPICLIETGIGLVNTAQALTSELCMDLPELVIHFGVAGAYSASGLVIGDLGVAEREIYGELGVRTVNGWQGAELIGIPTARIGADGVDHYNYFTSDAGLVETALATLNRDQAWPGQRPRIKAGSFVTVQECSGTTVLGDERARRFDALCENMEGAAAAHICAMEDIPFLEVRAISNLVEDRDRDRWDLATASTRAQHAATLLVEEFAAGGFE